MTQAMRPPGHPDHPHIEGEDDVIENILDPSQAKIHLLIISYEPKDPKTPPRPSWHTEFPSATVAREAASRMEPDPKAIGSPKQAKARRAKLLRLLPDELDLYNIKISIEPKAFQNERRLNPNRPPAGIRSADRAPVHDRPAIDHGGRSTAASSALSLLSLKLPEIGGEAEDGGEEPGPQIGRGTDEEGNQLGLEPADWVGDREEDGDDDGGNPLDE